MCVAEWHVPGEGAGGIINPLKGYAETGSVLPFPKEKRESAVFKKLRFAHAAALRVAGVEPAATLPFQSQHRPAASPPPAMARRMAPAHTPRWRAASETLGQVSPVSGQTIGVRSVRASPITGFHEAAQVVTISDRTTAQRG